MALKKSISYWSFEGGLEGKKDISECLSEAKDAGFEAVELAVSPEGELTMETGESECKKIHFKDFDTSVGTPEGFCDLTEGDVNWEAVMEALGEIGYEDYLTAEMVPPEPGIVEKTSKAMDNILSVR